MKLSDEIKGCAHCAHTMSRIAVDYRRMACEFPWRHDEFMTEALLKREAAKWWLDRARWLKQEMKSQ